MHNKPVLPFGAEQSKLHEFVTLNIEIGHSCSQIAGHICEISQDYIKIRDSGGVCWITSHQWIKSVKRKYMATKALGQSDFRVGETVEFHNTAGYYQVAITELKHDRLIGHFSTMRKHPVVTDDITGGFFYSEIKPGTLKRLSPTPAVAVPEVTINVPASVPPPALANGWYLVSNPTSPSGEDMIIRVVNGKMGILFGDGGSISIYENSELKETNIVKCRLNFVSQ